MNKEENEKRISELQREREKARDRLTEAKIELRRLKAKSQEEEDS